VVVLLEVAIAVVPLLAAVVGPEVIPAMAMGAVDIGPVVRWEQRLELPPTAIITNPTTTAITASSSAATIPIHLATKSSG
jgi:hypothetical protein